MQASGAYNATKDGVNRAGQAVGDTVSLFNARYLSRTKSFQASSAYQGTKDAVNRSGQVVSDAVSAFFSPSTHSLSIQASSVGGAVRSSGDRMAQGIDNAAHRTGEAVRSFTLHPLPHPSLLSGFISSIICS